LQDPGGHLGGHEDGADLGAGTGEPLDGGQPRRIGETRPEERHDRPTGRPVFGEGGDVLVERHPGRLHNRFGDPAGPDRVRVHHGHVEAFVSGGVGHDQALQSMGGEHIRRRGSPRSPEGPGSA
jgi:hypothetical protein